MNSMTCMESAFLPAVKEYHMPKGKQLQTKCLSHSAHL